MTDSDTDLSLVDHLAEEFVRRWRAGERPSPDDYAARHPQLADEIREVFAGVLMLERLKPQRQDTDYVPARPADAGTVPETLGEYRVVRAIGRGGMGVVYEAVQESLGRRVAIKVLPPYLVSDETVLARFRRESRAAAQLHHTNIVPVFGVGECGGTHFYVMQLIDGRGLDRVVAEVAAARGGSFPVPA